MQRWEDISTNPNSLEAILWRRKRLRAALQPPLGGRIEYLQQLARGKRVLDVGVVDHEAPARGRATWLHGRIATEASYCLGVDVLADDIEKLRAEGYNVRCCDITTDRLDEKFDVVLCGELIEHLDRPGDLMAAARRLLGPGGRLVLTAPNPHFIGLVLLHWFGRCMDSVDHVTYFAPSGLAELAERHGLLLKSYRGVMLDSANWREKLIFKSRHVLRCFGIRREACCTTLLYEFAEADDS